LEVARVGKNDEDLESEESDVEEDFDDSEE
jgi:hypothetical protein